MRVTDGSLISRVVLLSTAGGGNQVSMHPSGILYTKYNNIYITLLEIEGRRGGNGGKWNIAVINALDMTVTKWLQQKEDNGYFAALAFRDFGNGGENVYVGGARYYDDDEWVMAIVRCQEGDVKDIGSLAHWT